MKVGGKTILILILISITVCFSSLAQTKTDSLFLNQIIRADSSLLFQKVIEEASKFRCQIIYTQIDRTNAGTPRFKQHYFNVNPDLYFNPASMVKMPMAFLALEKTNRLKNKGVTKDTPMVFDSSYPKQIAMLTDPTAENQKPSVAQFIKRAFLISENDPYNRLYQFVGQGPANRALQKRGYRSARITRQFMGYTEDQNRHTNGIRFLSESGQLIYQQPPAFNKDSFRFPPPVLIGDAHINRNEQLVRGPFDFTKHNNISLEDLQQMLQAVVFPTSVSAKKRFKISESDRLFLLQYLSQYPSETNYPLYDDSVYYDSYVKFFFKTDNGKMPKHIRVFNKVGWAYGFLTDVSYIVDTLHNIDYFLSATLYVNSDGVVNDSKYDEKTTGFPFLLQLGQLIYNYELKRPRTIRPELGFQGLNYPKRTEISNRTPMKEVDN